MSVEHGVVEATVRIRTSRQNWIVLFVAGLLILAMQTLQWGSRGGDGALTGLGGMFVGESLWMRSFGVDLTPEFANVRGLLRRRVRWDQVQAVQCFRQLGSDRVCLVLENGQVVNLRAPTTSWGFGAARYEHDFHRIGQWWLAHRGPSWRPIRPEAPGAPTPEWGRNGYAAVGARDRASCRRPQRMGSALTQPSCASSFSGHGGLLQTNSFSR